MHGIEPERLFLGRCWQRFARDLGGDPADELHEPGAAGVDDTRLAEHVEQLRRSGERGLPGLEGNPQELSWRRSRRRLALGRLRHLSDDCEHRALDGRPDSAVGHVARLAECPCEHLRVDRRARAEDVCGAADDLRQDHAGVPPRAHESGAGDGVGERRPRRLLQLIGGLDERAYGERDVRPRVAVRNRIHVEVVDA